jgi:hypothetical protein
MKFVGRIGVAGVGAVLAVAGLAAPASAATPGRSEVCPGTLYCGSATPSRWTATSVHMDWSVADETRNGRLAWARVAYQRTDGTHGWGSWVKANGDGNGLYTPASGTRIQTVTGIALQICEHSTDSKGNDVFTNCAVGPTVPNPVL